MSAYVAALLIAGVIFAAPCVHGQDSTRHDPADSLFAHAAGSTPAGAADDYRRIVVEYPESPHAKQAVLRLAQLELVQGDRQDAAEHLARFSRDHTSHGPAAAQLEFDAGQAYLQLDDIAHGCAMLAAAKSDAAPSNIELINRITYAQTRCRARAVAAAPPVDTAHAPNTHGPSTGATPPAKAATTPGYTVQIGAYTTRAEANDQAKKLSARGYAARVLGTKSPYRVQIGLYRTRAQAEAERKTLAAHGLSGFVSDAQ